MLIKFCKENRKRLLSLLLALTLLMPNSTGIAMAAESDPDADAVCGTPAHVHSETCVESVDQLICGKKEGDTHAHVDTCYQNVQKTVCGQQVHVHTANCYALSEDNTVTSALSTGTLLTSPAPGMLMAEKASTEGLTDISGYTVPIVIYNYLYRTGAAGEALVMSHNGVFAFTGTFNNTITIGGDTTQTNDNSKPSANDITVELQDLQVNNTVTVKDVYPGAVTKKKRETYINKYFRWWQFEDRWRHC